MVCSIILSAASGAAQVSFQAGHRATTTGSSMPRTRPIQKARTRSPRPCSASFATCVSDPEGKGLAPPVVQSLERLLCVDAALGQPTLIPEAQPVAVEISRRAPDGAGFVLVSATIAGLLADLMLEKMRTEVSPQGAVRRRSTRSRGRSRRTSGWHTGDAVVIAAIVANQSRPRQAISFRSTLPAGRLADSVARIETGLVSGVRPVDLAQDGRAQCVDQVLARADCVVALVLDAEEAEGFRFASNSCANPEHAHRADPFIFTLPAPVWRCLEKASAESRLLTALRSEGSLQASS